MKILVINNGSTSFRFKLIESETDEILASGSFENIGTDNSYLKYKNINGINYKYNYSFKSISDSVDTMTCLITDRQIGVVQNIYEIKALGFRVVHGGEIYKESTLIDDSVINNLIVLSNLMPLHGNNIIDSINECGRIFNNSSEIAVFDTTFHSTIPIENYLYALPKELYEKYGIRKYGFHGISYSSVLDRYSELIGKDKKDINTIICHMGGGCSMCCIKNGQSFDTTMEFTPVSGLIMASRSGSIDPGVITYLIKECKMSIEEIEEMINKQSGYFAVCNDTDAKSIVERSINHDQDAMLLRRLANIDFKKHLLMMMANLEHTDSIIFTGGMGTKNKEQREMFMENLKQFGIIIDKEKNNKVFDETAKISSDSSNIPIYVVPDDEERQIVKECVKVLKKR